MGKTSNESDWRIETLEVIPQHLAKDFLLLDKAEVLLSEANTIDLPVKEEFEKDTYVRTIFIPAYTILTSRIHKYEHIYIVKEGMCSVFTAGKGIEHIRAPYMGVTMPFTRRMIVTYEDVVWTTYHEYNGRNRDDMIDILTFKYENALMDSVRAKKLKGAKP